MEFNKICRACLTTKSELCNLFVTSTSEMFAFCTSVQVSEHDTLPKAVCQTCFDLFNKFFFFKQQCIQSNETLHQCILSSEDVKPDPSFIKNNEIKIEITPDILSSPNLTKTAKDSSTKLEQADVKNRIKHNIDLKAHLLYSNSLDGVDDFDPVFNDHNIPSPDTVDLPKLKLKRKKIKPGSDPKLKKRKKYILERKNLNLDHSCVQCNKKFAYPERLEAHKLSHQGVTKEIFCNICDKKFKQWDGLRRHREFVHTSTGKTLECPTCGKLYKTTMTLRNHQKIHEERKDFVCHICGGSYRSAGGLQNHVETHRENREKKHECKICNKKFVSNSYLTSHMFRHKERRFVCHVCRFPFFTKADLTRHMLIHNGIKPFVCEICNKAYSTKSFLIEHGRTHSGERPFSCDYCPMNFISKRRLIDHRRTHTGEKPHKCDKCNQAFIQRGSLTRHLRVHEK